MQIKIEYKDNGIAEASKDNYVKTHLIQLQAKYL